MFRRMAAATMIALAVCAGGCALRQKTKPQPDLSHIFRPRKLKLRGPV